MSQDRAESERHPIRTFRDLMVWQKATEFAKGIYLVSKEFPRDERFGLTNQLRRAAVSVSSNIAEGHARQGKEFPHFLSIARGSLVECESQLHLAVVLGFIPEQSVGALMQLASEIHRMSASLVSKLQH